MREDVLEVKLPATASVAIGGDILATIQPIPIVSPEKAAENKQKAKELGSNIASGPRKEDGEKKEPDALPPPDLDDRGGSAPAPQKKSDGAEPGEEPL